MPQTHPKDKDHAVDTIRILWTATRLGVIHILADNADGQAECTPVLRVKRVEVLIFWWLKLGAQRSWLQRPLRG